MPYLRLTCPPLAAERRGEIARALTDAVVELFTPPRGPVTAADLRSRTTVHFACYAPDELFIGGQTPDPTHPDVTIEVSDWSMSSRQQARVAARLTPLIVGLFDTEPSAVNLRFHSYPPTDFAVGGLLLSARIPRIARVAKRLFG
ncbi:tautomerase family protein [Arthrobacter sp. RHLT1-20]